MSDDTPHQVFRNLRGPLCKIFWGSSIPEDIENAVNTWIKEHPSVYLEQQETTNTPHGLAVTIWYTEDSAE